MTLGTLFLLQASVRQSPAAPVQNLIWCYFMQPGHASVWGGEFAQQQQSRHMMRRGAPHRVEQPLCIHLLPWGSFS